MSQESPIFFKYKDQESTPASIDELKKHLDKMGIRSLGGPDRRTSPIFLNESELKWARFEIIEGNLQTASSLFERARKTAEEKGLGLLVDKVLVEKRQLEEELDKWQELIQRNAPLKERLEQARLEKYMKQAKTLALSGREWLSILPEF